METCIITKETLPNKDVAITAEGPVAVSLWKEDIKLENGYAIPNSNVQNLFETNCGRNMSLKP